MADDTNTNAAVPLDQPVTGKPESMAGWSFEGEFERNIGSRADVTVKNDGAELFRDVVKLDDRTNIRVWVTNLMAEGNLSDEQRDYIEANPSVFDKDLRTLYTALRDRRKADAEREPEEAALPFDELPPCDQSKSKLTEMDDDVISEAKALLKNPKLIEEISRHIAYAVAGEKQLARLGYLFCTSRLLRNPMNIIVTGASSSGKSHVMEQTGKFMPEESVLTVHDSTENALFYMSEHALKHCIVLGGERRRDATDANADRTRPYREMISSGRLIKLVPMRQADGTMRTERIVRDGPIGLSESTTAQDIDAEDANRAIVINTDESQQQTQRIIRAGDEADEAGNDTLVPSRIYELHHAMQRILERASIKIPFAKTVGEMVTPHIVHNLESRRAWPQCKRVMKASALLHQFQRDRDEDGNIIATLEDYQIARDVLGPWLEKIIHGGISEGSIGAFERLVKAFDVNKPFTITEAEKARVGGESQLRRRWLPELERAGLVDAVNDNEISGIRRGRPARRWRLTIDEVPEAANSVLPSPEAVARKLSGDPVDAPEPEQPIHEMNGQRFLEQPDGSLVDESINGEPMAGFPF